MARRKKLTKKQKTLYFKIAFVVSVLVNVGFLWYNGLQVYKHVATTYFNPSQITETVKEKPKKKEFKKEKFTKKQNTTPEKKVNQEPIEKKVEKVVEPVDVQKPKFDMRRPKIILVIDDMGNKKTNLKYYEALGDRVTYAILPFLPYSQFFGNLSQRTGANVILHLPLEASDGTFPGPGLLTTQMSDNNIIDLLHRDLETVPYSIGANSHMGSKGTSDYRLMHIVLSELQKKGMLFLDSYTTADSVSTRVSRDIGYPILTRDIFLDNVDTEEAITQQLYKAAEMANRKKFIIAIGHDRRNTLQVLINEVPALEAKGFQFISLEDAYLLS